MNTITDDQIAEIERNVGFKNGEGFYLTNIHCVDLLALITRLREAERDAARYRWLRYRGDACQWMNIIRVDLEEFVMQDNALDAAIDAAMMSAREAAE